PGRVQGCSRRLRCTENRLQPWGRSVTGFAVAKVPLGDNAPVRCIGDDVPMQAMLLVRGDFTDHAIGVILGNSAMQLVVVIRGLLHELPVGPVVLRQPTAPPILVRRLFTQLAMFIIGKGLAVPHPATKRYRHLELSLTVEERRAVEFAGVIVTAL